MGRTGRCAGQAANTTLLCETTEGVPQAIALIELARSGRVESVEVCERCWPVLVHQLWPLALAGDGVPPNAAWVLLSRLPDLRGVHRPEHDALIAQLLLAHHARVLG